jgi:hypothetical protein
LEVRNVRDRDPKAEKVVKAVAVAVPEAVNASEPDALHAFDSYLIP